MNAEHEATREIADSSKFSSVPLADAIELSDGRAGENGSGNLGIRR